MRNIAWGIFQIAVVFGTMWFTFEVLDKQPNSGPATSPGLAAFMGIIFAIILTGLISWLWKRTPLRFKNRINHRG